MVSPTAILGAIGAGPERDPFVRAWTETTEAANVRMLDTGLALAEEKEFVCLLTAFWRNFVVGGILGAAVVATLLPFHASLTVFLLLSLLAGELTRTWLDESWSLTWLEMSVRDLEMAPCAEFLDARRKGGAWGTEPGVAERGRVIDGIRMDELPEGPAP
jgi:hypothetical protein